MKIYHNPRCSKSRETLALLQEHGAEPEIVLYLNEPLTGPELRTLLKKLGLKAHQLIRKGEAIYKQMYKGQELSEDDWIDVMTKHPKLIERPIVVNGRKAVLGRPPQNVLDLL